MLHVGSKAINLDYMLRRFFYWEGRRSYTRQAKLHFKAFLINYGCVLGCLNELPVNTHIFCYSCFLCSLWLLSQLMWNLFCCNEILIMILTKLFYMNNSLSSQVVLLVISKIITYQIRYNNEAEAQQRFAVPL